MIFMAKMRIARQFNIECHGILKGIVLKYNCMIIPGMEVYNE